MDAHNFTGGEKLQAKLAEMAEKVSRPATLRVGFLEGATYPATKPTGKKTLAKAKKYAKAGPAAGSSGGKLVAMIAAIQEFGAPSVGIPPRPYFRRMIRAKSPTWERASRANSRKRTMTRQRRWGAPGR